MQNWLVTVVRKMLVGMIMLTAGESAIFLLVHLTARYIALTATALYDIKNNRQTVADLRLFFKAHQRHLMIATGVNDPLFPGAIRKPPADMLEIGVPPDRQHFALEDHWAEIGSLTRAFLGPVMTNRG
jgi:hypothetical protein